MGKCPLSKPFLDEFSELANTVRLVTDIAQAAARKFQVTPELILFLADRQLKIDFDPNFWDEVQP